MIEKLIENWLIKASERSYQIPFCYLLIQEGKTILHMTRHSMMEHGKDIVAIDEDGQVYAYQLKGIDGGRLTINGWKEILPQLNQLVFTPVTHPSCENGNYHKSYLVINGEIEEEVQHAITAFNSHWEKKGISQYSLATIVKGQILDMALKAKESFLPTEIPDFKALLEFQLEDGVGFLNKEKFSSMLLHLIDSESNDTNKKFKRAVSSAALLCSLATSSFTKSKNHFAIVEAWVVYLFTVLYAIERRLLSVTDYNQEINYAQNIILHSLRNLFEEVKDKEEFLYDDPLTDAFVYRHRLTILLGASASLGIVDSDTPTLDIERFIQKHTGELILWGESAIPFYLAIYFFYKKRNEYEKANAFLERTFEQTIYAIKTPGTFFPDVYVSAEKAIEMNLPEDNDREELITPRIGFILEPLICMLASLGLREALARNWYEVSKCIFSSTEMDYPFDFYKWRITGGNHINRHPQQLQRWSELVNYAKRFEINKLPKTLLKFKEWIPLFLIVYPHRINSNLVKWAMTSEITEI